jgi:hypothetical protein
MRRHAYNNRRDANEVSIVEAFKAAGAKVWRLERPVDLLLNIGGQLQLVECKVHKAGLNAAQIEVARDWPFTVIRSPEEAIELVNSVRKP